MTKQTLIETLIPELPNRYRGKVRDNYDLPDDRRIIITTDRMSAFDRSICAIPEKGRILTQIARYGFTNTADLCQNHAIEYPDPNVIIARRLRMLPVEIVVRDYLAGTTATSILTMYKAGHRHMYGIDFPDGLIDNSQLPWTIITPTTKSDTRDEPVSPQEIITRGLMSLDQWEQVEDKALLLFARGRTMASEAGMIIADTKYEFGLDEEDRIVLADEIHTPDSSRYWFIDSYLSAYVGGYPPPSFDKDVIRRWISEQCDPYAQAIPEIPADVITATSNAYMAAYCRIIGEDFIPTPEEPIMERIRNNLIRIGVLYQ